MKYTATLILLLMTGSLLSSGELHAQGGRGKKKPTPARGNRLYGYIRNQHDERVPYVCLTDSKNLQTYQSDSRGNFFIKNIELKTKLIITGYNLETTDFIVTHLGMWVIMVKEKQRTFLAYETVFTGYQPLIKKTTPGPGPIRYLPGLRATICSTASSNKTKAW